MLSSPIRHWPAGGEWVLEPKHDGFRLLIEVGVRGRVRAWSRHGTSLTTRLGDLLDSFAALRPGAVFDGELVALAERDGQVVQDFAAVGRAVFGADRVANAGLHVIAFDLLALAGVGDLRAHAWRERREMLLAALPDDRRIRPVQTLPASAETHHAIVDLGFEGSVLKNPGSRYIAGRSRAWRKLKARQLTTATLVAVHLDRDGRTIARCELDVGQHVAALAQPTTAALIGESVTIAYSRVDAGGGLREARLVANPRPEMSSNAT